MYHLLHVYCIVYYSSSVGSYISILICHSKQPTCSCDTKQNIMILLHSAWAREFYALSSNDLVNSSNAYS